MRLARRYKTGYLALSLQVAIGESLLHDVLPVNGHFPIALGTIARQVLHRFSGPPLRVLSLTGALLKRAGGSAELAGTGDYHLTQQWSQAVYDNPASYDGLIYASRHVNTGLAVVLFDRCSTAIKPASQVHLLAGPSFAALAQSFGIVAI